MAAALVAFFLWGVLPVYWKQFSFLPASSIVAQRTVWSLVFVLPVVWFYGNRSELLAALKSPRALALHGLSGLLLLVNWVLFVWATLNGHILEAALGYYLNPFFNMAFGTLWFGERHNRVQLTAIGIALAGVSLRLIGAHGVPWIALGLAGTFALYSVVRKVAPLGSLSGLALETLLLFPLALIWLFHASPSLPSAFGGSWANAGWVVSCGMVTAVPLLCFAYGARNIRLTTLGILQFLGPSLQFLCGWLIYGEALTSVVACSFALIWLAAALYALDALRQGKTRAKLERAVELAAGPEQAE